MGRVADEDDATDRPWPIEVFDPTDPFGWDFVEGADPLHVGGPHPGSEQVPWCAIFA